MLVHCQLLTLGCSRSGKTPFYDARYQGIVKVYYPFHGLLGKKGKIVRKVRYGRTAFLDIDVDGTRHTVPEWMTDVLHCQSLTRGDEPFCSWAALQAVFTLFDRV